MNERIFDFENSTNTSKKQKSNTDINLEDVIQYYLMPTLQHVAISNIIITLWNRADIKYEIVKLYDDNKGEFNTDIYRFFPNIEDKVIDKVLQLSLPHRIRKILSSVVKPIGNEIATWILYHDYCIFNLGNYFRGPKSIAINYIDCLVWTLRGRIDYHETAKTLLVKEKLFDYKYDIACAYCFDNIAITAPNVINSALTLKCTERQAMVYFWTAQITGDFTELDKAVYLYNREYSTDYSINEYLFKMLIKHSTNQIAIKYIWDKLSNEEKSRQIVHAIKETTITDIRCFLLSQISKEQEKEVFKMDDANVILLDFLDDWFWGHYFLPAVHHIWNIISGWDYLVVLVSIVDKMRENHEDAELYNHYKFIFKELWQCAPKNVKKYIFENYNKNIFCNMFLNLFYKKNLDIIHLILSDINDVKKKQMIFSRYGIEKCSNYLKSDQWDLLEMLIDHTLFSGEDVDDFKQALIKEKGKEISIHLIRNKEWDKVDQFLQWTFISVDVRKFKLKLAYCKFCNDILESMVANNKADFLELETFLDGVLRVMQQEFLSLKKK